MKQLIVAILSLLMLSVQFARAEDTHTRELLIVRGDGDWPPLEMGVDGVNEGLHFDLVRDVAKRLNIKIRFKSFPWKRAIEMVRSGKADAITYMSYTQERTIFGIFLEDNILSHSDIALFTLKENADKIKFTGNLRELENYSIGTLKGYAYEDEFDAADYLEKDNLSAHEKQLVLKIVKGRLPIAIGNVSDIKYFAKELGVGDQIAFLEPHIIDKQANYIVFSKLRDDGIARLFADEMKKYKQTQSYQDLLQKYGLND
ncbi:substrate-binding periplasmic protein [Vibrio sp. HN007]|uniref:substrate-binding periplasmic protein n=1 Tax=Vibrio iocasae TaxID=3098914 RepID=UPI0035D512CF